MEVLMAFLSEILGRTVTDLDGNFVGKLEDLVARETIEFPHPVVDALVIEQRGELKIVPYKMVMSLFAPAIPLKCHVEDVPTYTPGEEDVYLSRDVLDKQIIDTDGARVVRVNDLELVRVNGTLYVSNVDVGMMGILRRIGLGKTTRTIASRLRMRLPESVISWDNVELLRHDQFMRLRVPADSLADLHPADVAEIISDLNKLETGQFLDAMNVEQLADTLEQVETDFQVSLVENMDDEKVADVLEEMEPDEAADLLAELPEERSRRLVSLMEKDEADDVRRLLAYPEDSAGGIMTTDFAVVPPNVTAESAIKILRETAREIETFTYVYVTDIENHLVGVFSLTELIFAEPNTLVMDFMDDRVKTVSPLDDQDEVAQVVTKYDLLAVPVVNEQNVIQGIVTADDALDKIIPTAWKKRLPRFYR
jgi:magnesium transporter